MDPSGVFWDFNKVKILLEYSMTEIRRDDIVKTLKVKFCFYYLDKNELILIVFTNSERKKEHNNKPSS